MIALGLASKGMDGYRLPPVQISNGSDRALLKMVKAVREENAQPDRMAGLIEGAIGNKVDSAKILALTTDEAAAPLSDEVIKARLQDAVTDTDYNGIILSLLQKYCPPGLMGLALTALLASFMSGMGGQRHTAFNTGVDL